MRKKSGKQFIYFLWGKGNNDTDKIPEKNFFKD